MKRLIALLLAVLCGLALTAGGSSTEWTMMDMKGQESRLSAQDAAAVDRCLKSKDWQDDLRDCICSPFSVKISCTYRRQWV